MTAEPLVLGEHFRCEPPLWARLERQLFAELDGAWRRFEERYTEGDGRLVFHDKLGCPPDDRDGVDDFYEAFFNWPILYLLGGSDDVLAAAKRHWEGLTRQLTELGMLRDEYERGYDWFHQGEGLLLFYMLCTADPADEEFRRRALRFADLYLGGPPGNYDPERNILVAPHVGAEGPRWGLTGGEPTFPWSPVFERYGLPLLHVDGISTYEQLVDDPALARRMGDEMRQAMGRGDTAVNLAATGLVTNAFLLSGDERYREWVLRYTGGWLDRMRQNDGILPDNVGLSGVVGEYLGGRWYGGHYGWSWPHGLHSVGTAAVVAGINASMLSRDDGYLDLARGPLDLVMCNSAVRRPDPAAMTMPERWAPRLAGVEDRETLLVPYRVNDAGWNDFQPMQTALPTAVWFFSQEDADRDRLRCLERGSSYDWARVQVFRDKEEAGHEEPWLAYLDGRNPEFPVRMLEASLSVVAERVKAIAEDPTDTRTGPATYEIQDEWHEHNPVVTEGLIQLSLGAPQVVYNGGLLQARVRYYDADRQRPGLPPGVAALVEGIEWPNTRLVLVNLDASATRRVVVQAGAFAEHGIESVRWEALSADAAAAPAAGSAGERPHSGSFVEIVMAPRTGVRVHLRHTRAVADPSYRGPWDLPGGNPGPSYQGQRGAS